VAIRVLTLEGSPAEMGTAHGEMLRSEIQACLARWRDELAATYGTSPDALIQDFLRETTVVRTAERLTPGSHEELEAIAAAAEVDPGTLWAWNLLDEVWWFADRTMEVQRLPDATACSSVAVLRGPSGAPIAAQNMDLDAFVDWDPYLLRLRPTAGPDALVLVNPGVLAQCGCNAHGISVCCNALGMLRPSPSGLPVTFIVREVLAQPDLASVRRFMHAVPHASGQNYLVGSPEGIVDLECSAGRVCELGHGDEVVVHTNHPLANDDVDQPVRRQNSYDRLGFLEAAVTPGAGPGDIQEALSDRSTPVCKLGEAGRTYAAMVMELTTPPTVSVSAGPPTPDSFQTVTF
jgi:hypothetical protein